MMLRLTPRCQSLSQSVFHRPRNRYHFDHATVAAVALLAVSCAGSSVSPTEFTVQSGAISSVTADASTVFAHRVSPSSCPANPPLLTSVAIVVRVPGSVSVTVDAVQLRFVDQMGVEMPPVTLPAPAMTTQFGSALVEARSQRTFPVAFAFGCSTGPAGTLFFTIDTRDANGRRASQTLRVSVR